MLVYFHAPCFDGAVSAALLVAERRARGEDVRLAPVGYDRQVSWLRSRRRRRPFAVVDFLYHRDADFWADHHPTAFLRPAWREHPEARRLAGDAVHYDPGAPSCASLLWRVLPEGAWRTPSLRALVLATEVTDAARYASPEEAVFGEAPAFRVARALGRAADRAFLVELVEALAGEPPDAVAARPEVAARVRAVDEASREGLAVLRRTARLDDGVVRFELPAGAHANRYAPYLLFPDAEYSVGLLREPGGLKVTAMRNPWKSEPPLSIGELMQEVGGGGHRRVGSVLLPPDTERPERVVEDTVAALRAGRRA